MAAATVVGERAEAMVEAATEAAERVVGLEAAETEAAETEAETGVGSHIRTRACFRRSGRYALLQGTLRPSRDRWP